MALLYYTAIALQYLQ